MHQMKNGNKTKFMAYQQTKFSIDNNKFLKYGHIYWSLQSGEAYHKQQNNINYNW